MIYINEDGTLSSEPAGPLHHFRVYAVYKHPKDYPDKFVLREWIGTEPQDPPICIHEELAAVRAMLPAGLTFVGPDAIDPCLIETWI